MEQRTCGMLSSDLRNGKKVTTFREVRKILQVKVSVQLPIKIKKLKLQTSIIQVKPLKSKVPNQLRRRKFKFL
jgi:hypothetical protein